MNRQDATPEEVEIRRLRKLISDLQAEPAGELKGMMKSRFNDLANLISSALQPARPVSIEAKEFLRDTLQPPKTVKKLTKKQQLEQAAKELSAKRAAALMQKHAKQPNRRLS